MRQHLGCRFWNLHCLSNDSSVVLCIAIYLRWANCQIFGVFGISNFVLPADWSIEGHMALMTSPSRLISEFCY